MQIQDFIQDQLENLNAGGPSGADRAALQQQGVEEFLYAKLISKKFRKWAVSEDAERRTRAAISTVVSEGRPLRVIFPFGGYKLWRLPTSPEVDWAEFFALMYYVQYLAPIAASYQPGVELVFASDDVIIERLNNVPHADTAAYCQSFRNLFSLLRPWLPSGLTIRLQRIGDLYSDSESFESELSAQIELARRYYAALDPSAQAKQRTSAELNFQWAGTKDLTQLSARDKKAVLEDAVVLHGAYCQLPRRIAFDRAEDTVGIFPVRAVSAIAVGTTKRSVTKFWTAYGLVVQVHNTFEPSILSPSQFDQLEEGAVRSVPTGLTGFKNLASLTVVQR